jgi:glycosyltransferase involved in cell wall biosynthesis
LVQYMASGLPVVGSPVGVNRDIIQDRRTGFSATSEQEWGQALEALISSFELRASMGAAGRERCVDHYSIRRWLPKILRVFDRVCRTSVADGVPDGYCKPAWN